MDAENTNLLQVVTLATGA